MIVALGDDDLYPRVLSTSPEALGGLLLRGADLSLSIINTYYCYYYYYYSTYYFYYRY